MSKERELLWRWHNGDLLPEEYMQLMKETKELLAPPETETEQEPAAWMYDWKYEIGEIAKGVYVGSHKASHLYELENLQPLYEREGLTPRQGLAEYKKGYARAETEQEPVAWRGVNFTEAEGDWVYRDFDEPFTDSNFKNVGEALYLVQPKREAIEDGELEVWYSQHTWAMDKQEYIWGFRDAEKAHGIGGK